VAALVKKMNNPSGRRKTEEDARLLPIWGKES